jgi:hypothetical protein
MRTGRVGSNAVIRFTRTGIPRVENTLLIPSSTKFRIGVVFLIRHQRHETRRCRTQGGSIHRSNTSPRRSGGRGRSGNGRVSRGRGRVLRRASVGTLPQGYVPNVPLPRIPLRQSTTSSNQIHTIPDYYQVPHGVPTYDIAHSIVENAAYAFSPAWHAIAINT